GAVGQGGKPVAAVRREQGGQRRHSCGCARARRANALIDAFVSPLKAHLATRGPRARGGPASRRGARPPRRSAPPTLHRSSPRKRESTTSRLSRGASGEEWAGYPSKLYSPPAGGDARCPRPRTISLERRSSSPARGAASAALRP